ncbi:MAG TPA: DNA-binding response regulator [Solibacterales bacterium]|nr:DNA-binding response regulator [Bryobacterales bacterium]
MSERWTAMIVDDEELARQYLRELLGRHPEVEIVAECRNGFEAVKAAGERKPDLLFLDIQMPKLDGFEVLELLEPGIAVVFVTAYDEYALKAFEVHAVDYLLKPFAEGRFEEALGRAKQRLGQTPAAHAAVAASARPEGTYSQRIVVRDGANVHLIPAERLDYAEAQDDYVALHTAGKTILKQQTIASLEAALDPARFVRVHRSYLVNLERVARIEAYTKDSKIVILRDGTQVPVSRAGLDRLKGLLDDKPL